MIQPRKDAALKVVRELGLIIVGVLVALAADSFWERRTEMARVESYVQGLATDLWSARQAVDSVVKSNEDMISQLDEFIEKVQSDLVSAETDRVPTIRLRPPRLPLGMIDVLLSTGDVNLISDQGLRAEIIRQHSRLRAALQEAEGFAVQTRATASEEYRLMEELRDMEGLPYGRPSPTAVRRSPALLATIKFHRALQAAYRARLMEMGDAVDALLAAIGGDPEVTEMRKAIDAG